MLHVLLDGPPVGPDVVLDGAAGHHLGRVLRARPGERLTSADGAGGLYQGTVVAVDRDRVVLHLEPAGHEAPPRLRVHAILPVLHRDRMSWAVEKLVELGIWSIAVGLTERSVSPSPSDRLRAVARSAAEQSRRAWVPRVAGSLPLGDALEAAPGPLLVADTEGARPLSSALSDLREGDLTILTGPEGGFGPTDRSALAAAGARPVTLGPAVLRAETAPIVLLAAIQHHAGVLDSFAQRD